MKPLVLLLALALPSALFAQDRERFAGYADVVIACFARAEPEARNACIGQGVAACEAAESDVSTLGTVACINAESTGWDEILEREYLAFLKELTARDMDYPPGRPDLSRVAALAASQHAWTSWRDAECFSHYAQWQDGTIRSVKAADCHRLLTAARAIDLKQQRDPEE